MNYDKTAICSAIAGVIALSAVSALSTTFAAEKDMEKCAGIVKGGQNDCSTSRNACHGHVAEDGDDEAWIYVPKGTCEKIAGAHITQQLTPEEQEAKK